MKLWTRLGERGTVDVSRVRGFKEVYVLIFHEINLYRPFLELLSTLIEINQL